MVRQIKYGSRCRRSVWPQRRACLAASASLALTALLGASALRGGRRSSLTGFTGGARAWGQVAEASAPGRGLVQRLADESEKSSGVYVPQAEWDEMWKEAYDIEKQRNDILREQMEAVGMEEEPPVVEPEACEIDWEGNYKNLAACNAALEEKLKSRDGGSSRDYQDMRDVAAQKPSNFKVELGGQEQYLQLTKFFGKESAFYKVKLQLPLGLNMTKRDSGDLQSAFVVENVIEGGSAAASGEVSPGDVLQAVTVVEQEDKGFGSIASEYQEWSASLVGSINAIRAPPQLLVDTTFIDTVDDLVDVIKSNSLLGDEAEVTMLLERNCTASGQPGTWLQPYDGAMPTPERPRYEEPVLPGGDQM